MQGIDYLKKRLFASLGVLGVIMLCGVAGYSTLEGWSFFDSFYMTVITITTIGYAEVHELSQAGKVFTVFLILFSVGTVFYTLNSAAKIIIEGELKNVFGRKRLEKKISRLKGHYILCGYGRMGRIIAGELRDKGVDFVVIEKEKEAAEAEGGAGAYVFQGDATSDESLKKAGIEKAKVLISVLSTDAENLYVVLSARELNPALMIVARASEEGSDRKLMRAGADRVVSPYRIGGLRIAHTVLKPAVVDFVELATKSGNIGLQMEEILVQEGSKLSGQVLEQCGIGRDLGIVVVAIKKSSGEMKIIPTYRTVIETGDTLIALGEISKLAVLEEMAIGR